jgi:hypothetical protein
LLFSGPATASDNPFVGDWNVTVETEPGREPGLPDSAMLFRFTENSYQYLTEDGRGGESVARTVPVSFRKESDLVWHVCETEGDGCAKATFDTPDHFVLQDYTVQPRALAMDFTRRK